VTQEPSVTWTDVKENGGGRGIDVMRETKRGPKGYRYQEAVGISQRTKRNRSDVKNQTQNTE
jgi:hypothetical protein